MMNKLLFDSQVTSQLPNKLKLAAQREGGEVVKNAIVANLHESGRAYLAKTALQNVGTLSAMEAQLTMAAPEGEERYRFIVDAYTFGAANKIRGW